MPDNPLTFHNNLIIRTPRLPFANAIGDEMIEISINDPVILEALYIASPSLYYEIEKYKQGVKGKDNKKLFASIRKYLLRMSNRSTPFGLFAGNSIVSWGPVTNIRFDHPLVSRKTKLDILFYHKLFTYLKNIPAVAGSLKYYPNDTMYAAGHHLHYSEFAVTDFGRIYQSSLVENSTYLKQLLQYCSGGKLYTEILDFLVSLDNDREDAVLFTDELINSKIIFSELELSITRESTMEQVTIILTRLSDAGLAGETAAALTILKGVQVHLDLLDANMVNPISAYELIIHELKKIGFEFDDAKLFHCNVHTDPQFGEVNTAIQRNIIDALAFTGALHNKEEYNIDLQQFRAKFRERYESRIVPLLEALDEEIGIGFMRDSALNGANTFIEDLISGASVGNKLTWGPREALLAQKIQHAIMSRETEIIFSDGDLKAFPQQDWEELAPSLSVVFRILENDQIHFEHGSGSSAINFLSRFYADDRKLAGIIENILAHEEANDPDIIYAEIVYHPSEARALNILQHPPLRKYELPVLSPAGVSGEYVLQLHELSLVLKNDELILYSPRLKKRVIPRLSNLHNYSTVKSHPIYLFLCELQYQHRKIDFSFKWMGVEKMYKFLPRVKYKSIILSAATWKLSYVDIAEYLGESSSVEGLRKFREKWMMPALVILVIVDNELLINFEDELSVALFLSSVKDKSFQVKEFLYPVADIQLNGSAMANQFVALLKKKGRCYQPFSPRNENDVAVVRDFPLGSEWLYLKLFCSEKSANRILLQGIEPLVLALMEGNYINSFFFIRFNQPKFHLRVRFRLRDPLLLGEVMKLVNDYVFTDGCRSYVAKMETETYVRELERYESFFIDETESLFHIDSMHTIHTIRLLKQKQVPFEIWESAMKAIDDLLGLFAFGLHDKLNFMDGIRKPFQQEFKLANDPYMKHALMAKYRTYRSQMDQLFKRGYANEELDGILEGRNRLIRPLIEKLLANSEHLKQPLNSLIASHTHMLINRMMETNPRLHEFAIYELMYLYYKSETFKMQKSVV